MSSDDIPEFDDIIGDVTTSRGKYSCPICYDFEADAVRKVQGHISGKKNSEHRNLGWNFESEIRDTNDEDE